MRKKLLENKNLCPLTFYNLEKNKIALKNKRNYSTSEKHQTHCYLLNEFYKPISSI